MPTQKVGLYITHHTFIQC